MVPARCRGWLRRGTLGWSSGTCQPQRHSVVSMDRGTAFLRRQLHRVCRGGAGTVGCFKESADWIAGMARGLGRDGAVLPRPPPVGRNGKPTSCTGVHACTLHPPALLAPRTLQCSMPARSRALAAPLANLCALRRPAPIASRPIDRSAHTGPVVQAQPWLQSADRVWTDADGQ